MQCNNCNCCNNAEQYEEFVPHKEYPIGGFFKIGKEVFKVVEDTYVVCSRCDAEELFVNGEWACEVCNQWDTQFILYDTLDDEL